jgi:hypothetical protein
MSGMVFDESTAEGPHGDFADWCKRSRIITQKALLRQQPIPQREFKFFFFPWYQKKTNRTNPAGIEISEELTAYFEKLESTLGIRLDAEQRAWYAQEKTKQGDKMKQEHPSTPEEAFERPVAGAYYGDLMNRAIDEGRICQVGYDSHYPVYTAWDLGVSDTTCIPFFQVIGNQIRFIDYHEDSGKSLAYYIGLVRERGYVREADFAPHDIKVREIGAGAEKALSRWETAKQLGLTFEIVPDIGVATGIEHVRGILPMCAFDDVKCRKLIDALLSYRREWNEHLERFEDKPLHDWASHPADAIRMAAVAYRWKKLDGRWHNRIMEQISETAVKDDYDPLWG